MIKYKIEPSVLHHYFHDDSAIHQIIMGIRAGFLDGSERKFNPDLIDRSRGEVLLKRRALDASTYPFAQDLSEKVYGEKGRVVGLVEGEFKGDSNINSIKSIVPIDLGTNPYLFFRTCQKDTTIDNCVTIETTKAYIEEYKDELSKRGYNHFEVGKSRFFYFRQKDLEFFSNKGELDMVKLVPLLCPTDYVVLKKVKRISPEEYTELAPNHTSYRLKESLTRKLLKKFGLPKGGIKIRNREGVISEKNIVVDWVGHRTVCYSRNEVNDLEVLLKSSPLIGKSKIDYLYTKDYYKKPKGQFKAKKVITVVSTKNYEPCIREIEVVDKNQYFENEFRKRTEHKEHVKKQKKVSKKKRSVNAHYKEILEQIFIKDISVIPI